MVILFWSALNAAVIILRQVAKSTVLGYQAKVMGDVPCRFGETSNQTDHA